MLEAADLLCMYNETITASSTLLNSKGTLLLHCLQLHGLTTAENLFGKIGEKY
jgi:hypothetical protein